MELLTQLVDLVGSIDGLGCDVCLCSRFCVDYFVLLFDVDSFHNLDMELFIRHGVECEFLFICLGRVEPRDYWAVIFGWLFLEVFLDYVQFLI